MNTNMTIGPSFNGVCTSKVVKMVTEKGEAMYEKGFVRFGTNPAIDTNFANAVRKPLKIASKEMSVPKEDAQQIIDVIEHEYKIHSQFSGDTINISSKYTKDGSGVMTTIEGSSPKEGDTKLTFQTSVRKWL